MKIFIKETRENKKFVPEVVAALQKAGHQVFLSSDYADVNEGIKSCYVQLDLTGVGMVDDKQSRRNFIYNYLKPAVAQGYVTMSFPGSPNKPEQTYRLTEKGLDLYKKVMGE